MGAFGNKKNSISPKKADTVISKLITTVNFEEELYRPIDTFQWKDASNNEVKQEAISHYGIKYAL